MSNRKEHWEAVYQQKNFEQVSWYQPIPQPSIDFLEQANLPKSARIIDVGAGESRFVDYLLNLDYQDITILDIAAKAIEKNQERLGEQSRKVQWVVSDIVDFQPIEKFDFWHDRAVFHFLTEEQDIQQYVALLKKAIRKNGTLVLATFSETGPQKCSGLFIKQYAESSLTKLLQPDFEKIRCQEVAHTTPSGGIQNFIFCAFRKC